MLNESEFIDTIIEKVGTIIDTHGMTRTTLIFEIMKMLTTLSESLAKKEEDYKKEKEALLERLHSAEAFAMRTEDNQNGRKTD